MAVMVNLLLKKLIKNLSNEIENTCKEIQK